jgi:hypothetical protein
MRPENYNSHSGRLSVTALCQVLPSHCNLYVGEAVRGLFYISFDTFPDAAPLNANAQFKNSFLINEPTLGSLPVQNRTLRKIISRAWASSTPPTCAVLDGRAPKLEQMGQPGRPLSRSRGKLRAELLESCGRTQRSFSWGNHYQLKSNCHEIPLQQTALNFRSLQNPASGFRCLRKNSGRSRRHRPSITLPASLSAVATLGSKPRTIRHPALSFGSCTPTKVGGFLNTSWATASNHGGPKQSAPANARRPTSSAASSCSYRFTINPHPAPTPITAGHPTRKGTLTD